LEAVMSEVENPGPGITPEEMADPGDTYQMGDENAPAEEEAAPEAAPAVAPEVPVEETAPEE